MPDQAVDLCARNGNVAAASCEWAIVGAAVNLTPVILALCGAVANLIYPAALFFMYFCAFWQLSKFNVRCSVNLMFAKSLFSEIYTQKAHFAPLGPSWGSYPPSLKTLRAGCASLHPAAKVERV